MKDTITEFFFFSEEDLSDFHYDPHKFGGLQAYDGYKYPASAMINFLLFMRLCRFKTREDWLEFLELHKGWAMALGFNNGVPHESDVTKFVNFKEDGFGLEFNVKKTKEKYYEHI